MTYENRHSNLARMVFASSPVRRSGSTLKLAPWISPTSRSAFAPESGAAFCVPPVMRSVFSGTESLGVKSSETDDNSSGGGELAPTLGISFATVEFVFVMCGLSGFSIWCFLNSSAVSLCLSLTLSVLKRAVEMLNGRLSARAARVERRTSLAGVIVYVCVQLVNLRLELRCGAVCEFEVSVVDIVVDIMPRLGA